MNEKVDIFQPMLDGSSPWCKNCGPHYTQHDNNRVPICNYDATSNLEKGRYECNCPGWETAEKNYKY